MSRLTSELFEITELAHHGPEDIFRILQSEEQHRDLVVHGERGGGGVHHLEMLSQHVVVGDGVVFDRLGVHLGVG